MARPSSCSRNAHGKTVLVRRAQSRIDQATLPQGNLEPCPRERFNMPLAKVVYFFGGFRCPC